MSLEGSVRAQSKPDQLARSEKRHEGNERPAVLAEERAKVSAGLGDNDPNENHRDELRDELEGARDVSLKHSRPTARPCSRLELTIG